ncbi:MAG TPA: ABC transporter ATP-binding protein [Myxococcota bacterium]|nr:ABC transporter ATP-binding protein [Myxococcota bacterium]
MSAPPPQVDAEAMAASRRSMFRRLWEYLGRHRGLYALGVVSTLGYTAAFVAVPILVGRVVQAINDGLGRDEIAERALWVGALTAVRAGLRFLSRTQVFNAAREVEYEMRNDLFAHLQRLPQSFFYRWRTGDLMSRCVNDLTAVRLLLGPGLISVIQNPILFLATFGAMFVLDAKLAALVLVPYPLFVLIARGFGRAMHGTNLAVQVGLSDLSSQLQETVAGIAVVKAYAMEDVARKRFEDASQELYRRQLRVVRVNGLMPAVTGLLPMLGMWIVFAVGGNEIQTGGMQVADFFTFTMYIYELTFPTFIMGWVFALIQRGTAAMQRIDEVLAVVPSIADRPDVLPIEGLRGEIELRDLSFRYEAGRALALRHVSLHIPAGSVFGVVGPVGSGKTTIASLIPRLHEVPDGVLFLDGIDVNRIPLHALRSSIAMVPQDSFLFSMTLADNVAYGLPSTDPERVVEASERAQLAKDVAELPDGYETVVGERGVMLSGGQRQRTALARALALRPSILILDDTLSSVDAETEAAIQRGLARVFQGRTVVLVASRVSTVRDADTIVVLDGGRIVEQGRHADLVAAGGLYARLAREQALEQELEQVGDAEAEALARAEGAA